MNEDEKLSFQQQIVLEQLRRNYQFTQDALKSIDVKAQGVIAIASIVISIFSSIRVNILQSDLGGWLIIVLILYGLTMAFAIFTIFPTNVEGEPLRAEWEHIYNSLNDPPFDFFHNLLSRYEDVIKANLDTNVSKTDRLKVAYLFLVITIAAILILSVIQPLASVP